MALKKLIKPEEKQTLFEERSDLKNLVFYTVVVYRGQGENIMKIFKNNKSSFQLLQFGQGTSKVELLNILSVEEHQKDIIYSIVREDAVPDIKKELDAYFASSKKSIGIAWTVKLNSLIGVKMYKFLTQTVRG